MHRTHIYKIPESDIEPNIAEYSQFVRKYHKIEFILSNEGFTLFCSSYRDFISLGWDTNRPSKDELSTFLGDHGLYENENIFHLFMFFIFAVHEKLKMTKEKADQNLTIVRFSRV